jgi:hypothetical protein
MNIGVIHTIHDGDAWREMTRSWDPSLAPEGITLLATGTSTEVDRAVCLWSGPSLEAVSAFLTQAIGSIAENDVFAVYDESVAIAGRPAEAAGV